MSNRIHIINDGSQIYRCWPEFSNYLTSYERGVREGDLRVIEECVFVCDLIRKSFWGIRKPAVRWNRISPKTISKVSSTTKSTPKEITAMELLDSTLLTGVKGMDSDHETLIRDLDLIDHLISTDSQSIEIAENNISILYNHCSEHFENEEKLMKDSKYPGMRNHMLIHRECLTKLSIFLRMFRDIKEPMNKSILEEITRMLRDWIVPHIKNEDMNLARHILNRRDSLRVRFMKTFWR